MWIQPYTKFPGKNVPTVAQVHLFFFYYYYFFKFDWYPHGTPGKSKCLFLTLSWDEQDWQHGALEKCNLSVTSNWNDLTGSEWACFCHKKAWNEKLMFPECPVRKQKDFPCVWARSWPTLVVSFFFVKCRFFHAVFVGGGEMQEEGEEKINMFLCKLSQTAA